LTQRLLTLAQQLDQATLRQVFTHTSWAPDRVQSYERLEFLGDSVLSLCITTELYRRFPDFAEGHLARLRAYIVSRATCSRVAAKLGLGKLLRHYADQGSEGGDAAQLQSNQNVLADLTESLIGAVYLTFGYEAVRPAVIEVFDEHIVFAEGSYIDHKTELQEHLARSGQSVAYKVLGFSGPPHNREFEIDAVVEGESLGRGFGTSKKRAEQEAAAEALHELQSKARRSARRARLRGSRSRKPELEAGAGSDETAPAVPVDVDVPGPDAGGEPGDTGVGGVG
jgi:ribonuclease-3